MDACGEQLPAFVEAQRELRIERMPMAGDRHVLIAIETNAHWRVRVPRRERCQSRWQGGLRFLPTEASPHARALHDDFIDRQLQGVSDDCLHFGSMLRRRTNEYRIVFARFSPGRLRF